MSPASHGIHHASISPSLGREEPPLHHRGNAVEEPPVRPCRKATGDGGATQLRGDGYTPNKRPAKKTDLASALHGGNTRVRPVAFNSTSSLQMSRDRGSSRQQPPERLPVTYISRSQSTLCIGFTIPLAEGQPSMMALYISNNGGGEDMHLCHSWSASEISSCLSAKGPNVEHVLLSLQPATTYRICLVATRDTNSKLPMIQPGYVVEILTCSTAGQPRPSPKVYSSWKPEFEVSVRTRILRILFPDWLHATVHNCAFVNCPLTEYTDTILVTQILL